MSAIFVEVSDHGDGKILKTPTGKYMYMDAKRNVSKKSYNDVGELLDGEKLRDGTEAKKVQERTRRSKRTTQSTDGSDELAEADAQREAMVSQAIPANKPTAKETATRKPAAKKTAK